MSRYEKLREHFSGRTVLNIVLDGWGIGKRDDTDAIWRANTGFFDYITKKYPYTTLNAHGHHVGLTGAKDLGGSEVGHFTMGAGTVMDQGTTRIQKMIESGEFTKLPVLREALEKARDTHLHLIGLLSDGNIHSHIDHMIAIVEEAAKREVKQCYIHALLDGRDVGIQSADQYAEQLLKIFAEINQKPGYEYAFASAGGREKITMDRDLNWQKVEDGWWTHVKGESGNYFDSILEGIKHFRTENPDLIDQDCPPFNIRDQKGEVPKIKDRDVVILTNFRGDRAIEIARAFTEDHFREFAIGHRPDVYFAGMMVYDEETNLPERRIMAPPNIDNPFGKRVIEFGLNQFRLAETQKFPHVTFFFNGGYRKPYHSEKEIYHLIDSDKIDSFADAPEMKANEIAAQAEKFILEGKYGYGLINFANADMVGHSGDMQATIKAVETVDKALKKICEALKKTNGVALINADHGNADEMVTFNPKFKRNEISTRHTINPVPCVIYDPLFKNDYELKKNTEEKPLTLAMVSGTNHIMLGKKIPDDLYDSLFNI